MSHCRPSKYALNKATGAVGPGAFVAEEPTVTRIEVEHPGWELLAEAALESRDSFANGWPAVLSAFAEAARPAR